MDYQFEKRWQETVKALSKDFGDELDLQSILLLIGFQESRQDSRKFSKDEKVELMHVAICKLLEPYGYYTFVGKDEEGWPHYERAMDIPALVPTEQDLLIKKAIINYFDDGQNQYKMN